MKLLCALVALSVVAVNGKSYWNRDYMTTSTKAWTPGKVYAYEYNVRELMGIPFLKFQLPGVGLRCKVIVEAKTPSELLVKMDDLKLAPVENEVSPWSRENWRKELPMNYSPMENLQGLARPFKVLLRDGMVDKIEVSDSEPIWVVNIKRGLVSKLSLNMNGIEEHLESYRMSGEPKKFVKEEPSVAGRCRTTYTIVPLPEYIAKSQENDLPYEVKESTRDLPAFVVTKIKDLTYCTEKPAFIQGSPVDMEEERYNPSQRFSSPKSITKYLIRGEPQHKFIVERIWSKGEVLVRPFATNTETILINSPQTLVLLKHTYTSFSLPEPSTSVRKSVVFEVVPRMEKESIRRSIEESRYPSSLEERRHPFSSLNERRYPSTTFERHNYLSNLFEGLRYPFNSLEERRYPSTTYEERRYPSTTYEERRYPSTTYEERRYPSTTYEERRYPSTTYEERRYPSTTYERLQYPSTVYVEGRYPSNSFEGRRSPFGMKHHNKVVFRHSDNKICFSVKPVPECRIGFQPTEHMTKKVGFHCLPHGLKADEMMRLARSEVLEELLNKSVDFNEYVSVPEMCKSIKEPTY